MNKTAFLFRLSATLLLLFVIFAVAVFTTQTQSLDISISKAVYSLRATWLTPIMFGFTFLGEANSIAFAAAFIAVVLFVKRHKHQAFLFVSSLIVGGALNYVLKEIFHRPRPSISPLIDLSATYSFPSGHAMASSIFYAGICYLVFHFTKNKKVRILALCLASLFIFFIGFSRVYLGVHYSTDVLAGYITGFFVFITVLLLDRIHILSRIKKGK